MPRWPQVRLRARSESSDGDGDRQGVTVATAGSYRSSISARSESGSRPRDTTIDLTILSEAENALADCLRDEPEWRYVLRVEEIELAGDHRRTDAEPARQFPKLGASSAHSIATECAVAASGERVLRANEESRARRAHLPRDSRALRAQVALRQALASRLPFRAGRNRLPPARRLSPRTKRSLVPTGFRRRARDPRCGHTA
jgi:hypothetical protein